MSDEPDARIPVVVGEAAQARPGDRVLPAPAAALPGHAVGCLCCRPRGALGLALAQLFMDRARDPVQHFGRVLVTQSDAPAVADAIDRDVLARARYRFDGNA